MTTHTPLATTLQPKQHIISSSISMYSNVYLSLFPSEKTSVFFLYVCPMRCGSEPDDLSSRSDCASIYHQRPFNYRVGGERPRQGICEFVGLTRVQEHWRADEAWTHSLHRSYVAERQLLLGWVWVVVGSYIHIYVLLGCFCAVPLPCLLPHLHLLARGDFRTPPSGHPWLRLCTGRTSRSSGLRVSARMC